MRLEYTNILEGMIKNNMVFNQYIDGRNLLSYLHIHNVIDFDEKEKLYELDPMECTQHLIKIILKSRKDKDMIHFLNSLQCAKYNDAFHWLTEKLENTSLTNKHQCVQIIDENINAHRFIWFDGNNPTVNFIERTVQLEELHNIILQSGKKVGADAKKTVITGLNGIGKTQLALRYIQLYRQQYDNIVWINAECDATFKKSFTDLAENLKINLKNANGVEKELFIIVKEVYTYFSKVKCLFVFDNADEPLKVEFYPDSQYQIYILITSRYQNWGQINIYNLGNFSLEEAKDFIQISLKIKTDIYEDQVANLAKVLHFFPLALKQATAYINETIKINKNTGSAYSIDDYINEYNEYKEKLLKYKFNSEFDDEYFQTMFITWKITIDKLDGKISENNWMQKLMQRFSLFTTKTENMANMKYEKIGKVAINILDYISYVACEKIDMQLFFPIEHKEEIGVAVQLLKQLSMVTEENGSLNVHPLIQEVTKLNIKEKRKEQETLTTVCKLLETYLDKLRQSQNYYKLKITLPHSEKLLQEVKNWLIKNPSQQTHIEEESIKNLLIQMSNAYYNIGQSRQDKSGALGQPEKRKTLLEKALLIKEKHYESDHYELALTLANLGNAYGSLRHPGKQKILLEKALPILEKHYGPDHYVVARALANLSNADGALGQPEKQKILLEKALAIQEKHYGPDHYEVAETLANLGNAYGSLGQHETQKTFLERALSILEKHYGSDHYVIARALTSLSNADGALGQPEKQKILLEKALAIQEKHYGPNHYEVAGILGNLGNVHGSLGQPEKQKTLLKKALLILEKHYGPDHYIVARVLANLSNAYGALGEPEKQKNLLEKTLVIQNKHYGPDHYEAAVTLANLGNAYGALGQIEKQKTLLERALVIKEKHYGPVHYEVAKTLVNLSRVFGALGQLEKQKTLLDRALVIQEKHYGQDHYELGVTLANIANAYGALGQLEKRKTLLKKALLILEKHYGPNHYKVAGALANLGNAYGTLGQPEKQKTLLERALVIKEKHYGPHHYVVARALASLSNAYDALGQPEEQNTLLEKALATREKHCGPNHSEVEQTLINLSKVSGDLRHLEKGATLLKRALTIQDTHAQNHYEVVGTSKFLKNAHHSLDNVEKQKTWMPSFTHGSTVNFIGHENQLKIDHKKIIRSGFQAKYHHVDLLNLMQNQFISNNIMPNVHICTPTNTAHPLPLVEAFDANGQLLSEYIPRKEHYEIQPSDISVEKEIGEGNYAIVAKGVLHNFRGLSSSIVVALKKSKYGNHLEDACLSNELNILLRIGQHCNIITMIGAITKPCHLGSFILVNEFCGLGDLTEYENLSPIDELNSVLNGSYLCFSALLMYALQIANGAYYYTQIKTVIHRDLALRNILLTSDHVVKIADFGLAVKAARYVVRDPKPSPIPWYAPECLHDTNAVFTAESDAWSYGVLLWELFSLAGNVFGVQAPKGKKELLEWILLGNRYEIPKYASPPITQLMKDCWQFLPENRPNFLQCRTEIQKILFTDNFEVFNYILQKIGLEIL